MTKRFVTAEDQCKAINAAISMPSKLFSPDGREYRITSWTPRVAEGEAIQIAATFIVVADPKDDRKVSPVDTDHAQSYYFPVQTSQGIH